MFRRLFAPLLALALALAPGLAAAQPQSIAFRPSVALAATLNQAFAVQIPVGINTAAFVVGGLTSSGAVVTSEYSDDQGATWSTIRTIGTAVAAGSSTITADGQYTVNAGGHTQLRMRVSVAGAGQLSFSVFLTPSQKEVTLRNGPADPVYTQPTTAAAAVPQTVVAPDEYATFNGTAYTASTGSLQAGAGSYVSFYILNPANSGKRYYIPPGARFFSCDVPTGNAAPRYASVSNPTVNLPPTTVTPTNRDTGGSGAVAATATVMVGTGTTRPDTATSSTGPGNYFPTGGQGQGIPFDRMLEPGQGFANFIYGANYTVGVGASTAMNCTITVGWSERPVGS